jgi:signal transduction histidine kinase
MGGLTPLLATGAAGLVALAAAAAGWALRERRTRVRKTAEFETHLSSLGARVDWDQAWTDAFGLCVLALEEGRPRLVSGEESLAFCARALGVADEPREVLAALMENTAQATRLRALIDRGEPCAFQVHGPSGDLDVEGSTSGAIAWLKLTRRPDLGFEAPSGDQFSALLESQPHPAWIETREGALRWASAAWLEAVEAASVQEAAAKKLTLGGAAESVLAEARQAGGWRSGLAWAAAGGERRAFKVTAGPLQGGLTGALAIDVTEAEETREAFRRHVAAHDETLNRLKDAVAMFSLARRLTFHNTAFAELWGLEPGWLAEHPSHGEVLDRLRQSRRLPETDDYAKWKAAELAHYEDLGSAPDGLWTLPDGRTLRVARQLHPLGGLLLLFSDVTDELRLRAQYNALIQVQQATLDKLNDAVAVFGSDGRLRLHNEAFERFWNITPQALAGAADFDAVVELCLPRLHDLQFWSDLKARIGDPDPTARVPVSGETRSSDRRILLYQSRPLPDGATLIAFTDVTDTRELERALGEREAALSEAERLKREFVGNVSYELRTPLTTIIGYAELLDHLGEGLPERARGHVAAVRQAARQLARSIDDVLDMAQIDADEMALDLGDVDVCELLGEAAERWGQPVEEAGASLELACEDDAGMIRADRRRLGQVLDHLIENAVRQSSPGGGVTLSARRLQNEVQISVADTGRGIPFHVQAHIFDRFVGRDRGGPGLGLALVKALVELHGGWVALESEPGKGATFTCHVPQMAQASAAHPELEL